MPGGPAGPPGGMPGMPPGGDPAALYDSLHHRLAKVPDEAVLYPGHLYSPQSSAPMGDTRRDNFVFMPRSEEQWLAMFGR